MIYHLGEIAVQERAGVQAEAERLAKGISSSIQPAAKDFLSKQRLAIASTVDARTRIWASLITGKPGFLQAVAAQTLKIDSNVLGDLRYRDEIGLLAIDLATRRRLRLNGKAEVRGNNEIYLHTQQVYFNCPKYIQVREIDTDIAETSDRTVQILPALTQQQQQFIHQADTFFIASYHPQSGADASHRGGYPGFVQVAGANTLVFPDYSGNNMFNTLGNLLANPRAGLLFIDFERGNTIALTGTATVLWEDAKRSQFAGAERLVEFQIEKAIFSRSATPMRWRFGEYSPYLHFASL